MRPFPQRPHFPGSNNYSIMKYVPILLILSSVFFSSCSGSLSEQKHEFIDARTGLAVNSTTYPGDWEVISKPVYTIDQKIPTFLIQIQGPNNLKSFNTPIKFHISYQHPQTTQFMRNTTLGHMMRPEADVRQLLQEEAAPRMENSGFTLDGEREFPEVLAFLNQKLMENSGGGVNVEPLSTVWTNGQGQKALVSVTKFSQKQPFMFGETMTTWFYGVQYLFVDEDAFEGTIASMNQALLNTEENPEWQQYTSHLTQQRMQESARQHQIRMQNRQAAFDAHQRKMQGIYQAQEANHAAFMNRNFGSASSSSQRDFLNMINEEETVHNPLTGENYQVDAGATQYWMDSDGNYIMNDDLFYTPNGDINLNNREWVQVEPR